MFYKSKKQAYSAAQKTLKKLRFKNFKIDVWENLGWHYCLQNKFISLSEFNGKYSVLINDHDRYRGGCMNWFDREYKRFADPNDAINHGISLVKKYVESLNGVWDYLVFILETDNSGDNWTKHNLEKLQPVNFKEDKKVKQSK